MIAPHPEIPPGWLEAEAPPLVLDLGCHRGHFLAALASERPDLHVLGVERLEERVERTRRKIQRLGLLNAAVLRAEIGQFVAGLPPESVSQAHILFPDPWPKRRHASRRLLNHAFIQSLERVIQPGGALRILTDHAEYARQVRMEIAAFPMFGEAAEPAFPPTAFEEKFRARGLPIERLYWVKGPARG